MEGVFQKCPFNRAQISSVEYGDMCYVILADFPKGRNQLFDRQRGNNRIRPSLPLAGFNALLQQDFESCRL